MSRRRGGAGKRKAGSAAAPGDPGPGGGVADRRSVRTRGAARRHAAAALALLAVLLVSWHVGTRNGAVGRDPSLNVLLVTIDTLRFDALGAWGETRGTSPLIDRLAAAGVRFETAHAHNTVTLPSHANILSGRYPFDHGVRDNTGFRFPSSTATLATVLAERGYATGAFVSAFALDSRFGLEPGFDVYDDSFGDAAEAGRFRLPERSAPETIGRARAWIARQREPWLAWVHLYDPHAPYEPPPPFASRFRDAPYLGEVAATDDALRALLEPVLDEGRSGRTVVVLTSDHGESLGEHGELTHGLFAYESTLRVPLVVYAPSLLRPRVIEAPARHVDILPTILDVLGVPAPPDLAGRSLLPLCAGQTAPAEPSYFEALSGMLSRGWAPLYGVVAEGHKLVDLPLPELYDLRSDPAERHNRMDGEGARAERDRLKAALAALREGDTGIAREEESAETRARLAALGYVTATSAPVRDEYTEADDPKKLVHLDRMMQDALARHREGDLAGAMALARRIVDERPEMTAALVQVALLERRTGRLEAAISTLERALATSPDDVSVAVMLGSYLGEAGRASEAADLLAPFASRADPPLDVLTTRAVALSRLGRTEDAVAAFEAVRARDPGNPITTVQIATVHLAAGETEAARRELEEALRLNPDVALAHHHLGLLALGRGDRAEAEARLRRALALDPGSADTLLHLGRLLAAQGRTAEARYLLQRFVAVAPPEIYSGTLRDVRVWLTSTRGA